MKTIFLMKSESFYSQTEHSHCTKEQFQNCSKEI